ncbi:flagellar hook-length control protein FliK [Pontibacillus litoralis]|uniref:Flagellar hook-length control protein-like C-terminal domain-containing protein n=1 Tax=Pontibacillus litoralis JSM 072002 TaxID=1385512 RepID=A0A0A5GBE1_9BACI|nr:flagellar hook-length control protein FliK [Pontibacillus litoralis]KGX88445.1 hypothetical protein N784_07200 [Pontibacillus litoralis JSM 072002]
MNSLAIFPQLPVLSSDVRQLKADESFSSFKKVMANGNFSNSPNPHDPSLNERTETLTRLLEQLKEGQQLSEDVLTSLSELWETLPAELEEQLASFFAEDHDKASLEVATQDLIGALQTFIQLDAKGGLQQRQFLMNAVQSTPTISMEYRDGHAQTAKDKQMQMIMQELTKVFNKLEQAPKQAKFQLDSKLFMLAKQWTALENTTNSQDRQQVFQQLKQNGVQPKTLLAWQQAIENFSNRHALVNQNQYSHHASVTQKEFSHWVRQALNNGTSEQNGGHLENKMSQVAASPMLMSQQEQWVMKLSQSNSKETMQNKLVEEFQKILKQSQFSVQRNGSQLLIKLKPGNLGEMMVRMTQQNGEMVVKLMVTTQAAKDMLEGNLQQLRHMFAPSQIQIEKHEQLLSTQQSSAYQEENGEHEEEHPSQQKNYHSEDDKEENAESPHFEEVLMNMKV